MRKVSSKLCLVSGGHATKGAKSLQCNAVVTAYIYWLPERENVYYFQCLLGTWCWHFLNGKLDLKTCASHYSGCDLSLNDGSLSAQSIIC